MKPHYDRFDPNSAYLSYNLVSRLDVFRCKATGTQEELISRKHFTTHIVVLKELIGSIVNVSGNLAYTLIQMQELTGVKRQKAVP